MLISAEAIFTLADLDENAVIGFAHIAENESNSRRRLAMAMRRGNNSNIGIVNMAYAHNFVGNFDWDGNAGAFIRNVEDFRDIQKCYEDSVKIAAARTANISIYVRQRQHRCRLLRIRRK